LTPSSSRSEGASRVRAIRQHSHKNPVGLWKHRCEADCVASGLLGGIEMAQTHFGPGTEDQWLRIAGPCRGTPLGQRGSFLIAPSTEKHPRPFQRVDLPRRLHQTSIVTQPGALKNDWQPGEPGA